jgi:hypothetical protein
VIRLDTTRRKHERGITIVLVAFSLLALLGMAALAIDVSTLYVAHGEAQRAADAAALAGARMFASSGYTTASTTLAASDICQSSVTPGADAAANRQAEAVGAQNLIAGQPGAIQAIACNITAANPQIAVTIRRTALPTFFGRIWGGAANTVTATGVAEAYNPSGSTAPIQVQGVKPWLIPDCDPTNSGAGDCAGTGQPFVATADGAIQNNGSFVGKQLTLTHHRRRSSCFDAARDPVLLSVDGANQAPGAGLPLDPRGFLCTGRKRRLSRQYRMLLNVSVQLRPDGRSGPDGYGRRRNWCPH